MLDTPLFPALGLALVPSIIMFIVDTDADVVVPSCTIYRFSRVSPSRAVRKNTLLTYVAQVSLTGPIMREEVDNPDSRARLRLHLRLRLRAFLSLPEPLTLTECAMSGACACTVSCSGFAGLPRHVSPPRTHGTGTVGMRDAGVIEGSRGRA